MVGCGIVVWLKYFIEVCEFTFEVGSVFDEITVLVVQLNAQSATVSRAITFRMTRINNSRKD